MGKYKTIAPVLVHTWCMLANMSHPHVRGRAQHMLAIAFNNANELKQYLVEHPPN